jgi:hypothetical protein
MSTDDQKRSPSCMDSPLLAVRDEVPQELLDRLAAAAEGNDRVRVETAGHIAGAWMANPASHQGHELVAAGLLLLAGVVNGDQLIEAVRIGYQRAKGSLDGYDPSR